MKLNDIKILCDRATTGPWEVGHHGGRMTIYGNGGDVSVVVDEGMDGDDAELMCEARDLVARLPCGMDLDYVRRALATAIKEVGPKDAYSWLLQVVEALDGK